MNLPKTEEELKEFCIELMKSRYIGRTLTSKCYDRFIEERNKPKLYDGLTKEQWDIVIKDELICEFWDKVDDNNLTDRIKCIDYVGAYMFNTKHNEYAWKHCRIHHSQTQFNTGKKPDWLDDKQLIACKLSDGRILTKTADWFNWEFDIESSIIRWQVVGV